MARNEQPEMMQAFVENINLIRGEVTGLQYHNYALFAKTLEVGDKLELRREKLNQYDRSAIAVYFEGDKIGFVASEDNKILSVLQDHEVPLEAYVTEHNRNAGIYKGNKRLMMAIFMPYTFVVAE